jgi:hypothetical protein
MSDADEPCPICGASGPTMHHGQWGHFPHNHKPDLSGLDDGPYLPGHEPRKKPAPKSAEETSAIRARAWATRRAKYGRYGHR